MLTFIMLIIHILTVILWIGGVGFVTLMVFPTIYKIEKPLDKVLYFQRIEHRFAKIAKYYSAVVLISGFHMVFAMKMQSLLFTFEGIPLTLMMIVGILWVIMLF